MFKSNLFVRVVSGVVAVAVLLGTYHKWHVAGVTWLSAIVILAGLLEYSHLAFRDLPMSLVTRAVFMFAGLIVVLSQVFSSWLSPALLAVSTLILLSAFVWIRDPRLNLDWYLSVSSRGVLGLVYCGLFPALAVNCLHLDGGPSWFLLLLSVVFAGDTAAYFSGRLFGKTLLAPHFSPKKTFAGAVGGLVGSIAASLVVWKLNFTHMPLLPFLAAACIAGIAAQTGDLFESLLKRIANVKDSGSIMPGHGGVLDRLDGIYFAAPVIYLFGLFMTR